VAVPVVYELPAHVRIPRSWAYRLLGWPAPDDFGRVVQVFDTNTGRERLTLPESRRGYRILGFAHDGRTFWTVRLAPSGTGGTRVFEQWPTDPRDLPGPPTW